jgi:hypothetical protein
VGFSGSIVPSVVQENPSTHVLPCFSGWVKTTNPNHAAITT